MTESLDRNTTAIDRNTQTLSDIRDAMIGAIPTGFMIPASVQYYGRIPSLQGGGHVISSGLAYVHAGETVSRGTQIGTVNVIISDTGQSAREIAYEVRDILTREFSRDAWRGFSPGAMGLPS